MEKFSIKRKIQLYNGRADLSFAFIKDKIYWKGDSGLLGSIWVLRSLKEEFPSLSEKEILENFGSIYNFVCKNEYIHFIDLHDREDVENEDIWSISVMAEKSVIKQVTKNIIRWWKNGIMNCIQLSRKKDIENWIWPIAIYTPGKGLKPLK